MNFARNWRATLLALTVSACGGGGGGPPPVVVTPGPVTSLSISPNALLLQLGASDELTAIATDAVGRTVDGVTVSWSVDDQTVATVSSSGQVEAIGLGRTPIRAEVNAIEASIILTVEASNPRTVASIEIDPPMEIVNEGQSTQFTAIARDINGAIITGRGENWTSGDATIAFVEPLGRTTGLRTGVTAVNVGIDGVTASATIRVEADYAFSLVYGALASPSNSLIATELFHLNISDAAAVGVPIFSPPRPATDPIPSPDGSALAFVVVSGSDTHIYRANRDGSLPYRLTEGSGLRDQPAWSPDGTVIAYRDRITGLGTDIWTMNAVDGSGALNLTADFGPTSQSSPAWSSIQIGGSLRIAFSHSEAGQGHIWSMRADGSDKTQLTSSTTAYDDQPTWSPDGSRIVFLRSSPSIFGDLYWVDASVGGAGAAFMPLIGPLAGPQFSPAWSPDGQLVAFTSRHTSEQFQIFTVWADGTRLAQRTFSGEHSDPAWIVD